MTEGQVSLPGSGTEGKGSRKTGECGINGKWWKSATVFRAFLGDEALLLFVFPLNLFAISDQYTFGTFLAPHHTRRQDEQPGSHQPCHLSRCHAMYVLSLPESQTASTPFVTPPPPGLFRPSC